MLKMTVKTGFETEGGIWLGVQNMQEELNSIRSRRILVVANPSIARLFVGRAPLVPETTVSIFRYNEPGGEGITEC